MILGRLLQRLVQGTAKHHARNHERIDAAVYLRRAIESSSAGNHADAESALRELLDLSPGNAAGHALLADVMTTTGRYAEAREHCEAALAIEPRQPEMRLNYAMVLRRLGEDEAAEHEYERLILERADWAPTYVNYGAYALERAAPQKAIDLLTRAISIDGSLLQARVNLAEAYRQVGRLQDALRECEAALETRPGYQPALLNMSAIQHQIGDADGARASLAARIAANPADGARIARALALPSVLDSVEHIEDVRHRLATELAELLQQKLHVGDPAREVGATHFHLAYHGHNDRTLHEQIAAVHLHACPDLAFVAPHLEKMRPNTDRQRIGILSCNLWNHSIGRVVCGLIEQLDARGFPVHVFAFRDPFDKISREIAAHASAWVTLPADLRRSREIVSRAELDVLLYPDIGMDPITYFLAFARLAPVQCTTWGHPVTTGLYAMDHFISTEYFEPPAAADHYTEQLVVLRDVAMPGYYARPIQPPLEHESIGGAPERRTYFCPQSLFKIHPDFDAVVAGILRADRRAEVQMVVRGNADDYRVRRLSERLARTAKDVFDRVRFLPAMPDRSGYFRRLQAADVVLDTFPYCGGNTSLEAISAGALVVTLPSALNRGRHTYGFYRKMRFERTIAGSADEYVDLAVRIATDRKLRAELRQMQKDRAAALYEDSSAVDQWAAFFARAAGEAARK